MAEHFFTPRDISQAIAEDLKMQEKDEQHPSEEAAKAFPILNALYKEDLRKKLFHEMENLKAGNESVCIMHEDPLLQAFARWMSWSKEGIYQYLFYSECLRRFNVFAENINLHLSCMADLLNILSSAFWKEFLDELNDSSKKSKKRDKREGENEDEDRMKSAVKPYLLFDDVYEVKVNSLGNLKVKVRADALHELARINDKEINVCLSANGYRPMRVTLHMGNYAKDKDGKYKLEMVRATRNKFRQYIKIFGHGRTSRI